MDQSRSQNTLARYIDLPDQVLVAANGYIAPFFWATAKLSNGWVPPLPRDSAGNRIELTDLNKTFATGLPVLHRLLAAALLRRTS